MSEGTASAVETWVVKQRKLLELERDEELNEGAARRDTVSTVDLQKRGVCLVKLSVASQRTGLGGRCLVDLELAGGDADAKLPSHRFRPGDIVTIEPYTRGTKAGATAEQDAKQKQQSATVARCTESKITISLDDDMPDELLDVTLRMDRVANDVTHKRVMQTMDDLASHGYKTGPSARIASVVFGKEEPMFDDPPASVAEKEWANLGLNKSQKDAVRFALSARDVAVIHGPPGTGKTTTVIEIIQQLIKRGGDTVRILACGPSNISVDNMVERLASTKTRIVRLGHPARLLPSVLKHALDAVVKTAEGADLVEDIRREMDVAQRDLGRTKDWGERRRLRGALKDLRKELSKREHKALDNAINGAQVVLCTITGAASKVLGRSQFDYVVIDEAPQALEAHCWIAMLRGKRVIIAGDHCQLPPTILSDKAARGGLSETLFDRIHGAHKTKATRMLETQYRMNEKIMDWSSKEMYEGRLKADPKVASHVLCELPGVKKTEETSCALFMIDSAGCNMHESESADDESKSNDGEADVTAAYVRRLLAAGVKPGDIAIITPYNAQVTLLKQRLADVGEALEIGSVDGFQGREKEAVVISMVRSNDDGEVGFLKEDRRMNVAVTRGRRHVCIVGDSGTLCSHEFLDRLVGHFMEHGEVRSAEEFVQ